MARARRLALVVAVLAVPALLIPGSPARAAPGYTSTISLVTPGELWASWRPGCPIGPDQLRRVTLSHWGFDGATHTGRLIVHADVAGEVAAIFGDLYAHGFPIERMVPVEAYQGSDDASMAANNTSGFNCRAVTGGTAWSEHAFGRAIDINPVQNPYVRGSTVLPPAGRAHLDRSTPAPGKILAGDGVVQAFAGGWAWGGNWTSPKDYQHFERHGSPGRPIPAHAGAGAVAPDTGRTDLFVRSPAGDVHQRTWSGAWSAPVSWGGYSDSTPDAASWAPGRVDVFVLGGDGSVWHRAVSGGTWSGWESLGGRFLSGPSAVSWGPDRVDVFGRGMDGGLWGNAWNGGGWSGWYSLGGGITSDPDVSSWGPGRLDVFARGLDGAIWHRGSNGGGWAPWDSLGGGATSGPAGSSSEANRIDVFTRGLDGGLWGARWNGAAWEGWYGLGGALSSDPEAVAGLDGSTVVFASGSDEAVLWSRARSPSGAWSSWQPIP